MRNHHPQFRTNGGVYYLHTSTGKAVVAVVSMDSQSRHLIYSAWPSFVTKYTNVFSIGTARHWNLKDLTTWLESLMYRSFVFHGYLGEHIYPYTHGTYLTA